MHKLVTIVEVLYDGDIRGREAGRSVNTFNQFAATHIEVC